MYAAPNFSYINIIIKSYRNRVIIFTISVFELILFLVCAFKHTYNNYETLLKVEKIN